MYWTIIGTVASGLVGIAIYVYYLRKGQFDDTEDVKYQMFREDNEKKE